MNTLSRRGFLAASAAAIGAAQMPRIAFAQGAAPISLAAATAAAAIAGTDRAAFVFMSVALLAVIATAAAIPAQRSEPQPAKTTRRAS